MKAPANHEKWKWKVVPQLCPVLCTPMDYTVRGILQARILEWVSPPFSRGSSRPRDQTQVSCTAGRFFTNWAIGEAHMKAWKGIIPALKKSRDSCLVYTCKAVPSVVQVYHQAAWGGNTAGDHMAAGMPGRWCQRERKGWLRKQTELS